MRYKHNMTVLLKRARLSIHQLTVGQRADDDVVGGDARAVLVVGHNAEAVLRVLLQPRHGVGLSVHVHVLQATKHRF